MNLIRNDDKVIALGNVNDFREVFLCHYEPARVVRVTEQQCRYLRVGSDAFEVIEIKSPSVFGREKRIRYPMSSRRFNG